MSLFLKAGQSTRADFQPLIDLLAEVQAADYDNAEAQVEHIERHLLNVEAVQREWITLAHAAGTASVIPALIPAHLWEQPIQAADVVASAEN